MKICKCGCGKEVPPQKQTRPQADYIKGHSLKIFRQSGRTLYVAKPEEIPSGLCECGCGEKTELAQKTELRRRWFRGHPKPFIFRHNQRLAAYKPQKNRKRWTISSYGYKLILLPNHPMANSRGYIKEHRLVMSEYLGRMLDKSEIVHHKNRNKLDNRIENLEIMSNADHGRHHCLESGIVPPLRVRK